MENLTNFKEEIKALRDKIVYTGEQFLVQEFKKIFEKYPTLKVVTWTGYTPSFCDGDPCKYSSSHNYPEVEWDDVIFVQTGLGVKTRNTIAEDLRDNNVKKDLKSFLSLFDNDLMLNLFDEDAKVIVTKEGIAVEEYYHD